MQIEGCFLLPDIIISQLQQRIFFMILADINIGVSSLITSQLNVQISLPGRIFPPLYRQNRCHQTGDCLAGVAGVSGCPGRTLKGAGHYFIIVAPVWLHSRINVCAADGFGCFCLREIFVPFCHIQCGDQTERFLLTGGTVYLITIAAFVTIPDNADAAAFVSHCFAQSEF